MFNILDNNGNPTPFGLLMLLLLILFNAYKYKSHKKFPNHILPMSMYTIFNLKILNVWATQGTMSRYYTIRYLSREWEEKTQFLIDAIVDGYIRNYYRYLKRLRLFWPGPKRVYRRSTLTKLLVRCFIKTLVILSLTSRYWFEQFMYISWDLEKFDSSLSLIFKLLAYLFYFIEGILLRILSSLFRN